MKLAIITGVSRGLGKALARILEKKRYRVLGIGRSPRPPGTAWSGISVDLSKGSRAYEKEIKPVLERLAGTLKPESVTLVNNAAVSIPVGFLQNLDSSAIEAILQTNLVAPAILAGGVIHQFAQRGIRTRIINVSSGAAEAVLGGSACYCASKSGIEALSRVIAAEAAKEQFPIEVVSFRPGIMRTRMQRQMREARLENNPHKALFQSFLDQGRLVDPEKVARFIFAILIEGCVESGKTYEFRDPA